MISLDHNTADTAACCYPHIMVLVLGNTTNVIIAKSLLLCQIVQTVIFHVEDVQTFTGTDP